MLWWFRPPRLRLTAALIKDLYFGARTRESQCGGNPMDFKDLTTFRVGGPVGQVVRAQHAEEFIEAVEACRAADERYLMVGGGSNILAPDEGFPGTVIIPTFSEIEFQGEQVKADAGAPWDAVVAGAIAHGLWGIENLSGIPGTVGGAVVANIGAYGAALSDVLVSVDAYDTEAKARRMFTPLEIDAAYRTTIFKQNPERYAILSATLALSSVPRPNLGYRDLAVRFPQGSSALDTIRTAVLSIRKGKFPDLAEYGTAGSFFLNPVVPASEAVAIAARYPGMPTFDMPEGGVKVPLAWILDHVIEAKSMREGGAFVWDAQPLVIAVEHDARAHDVHTLAEKITTRVKEKTNLTIIPEVRVL